MLVRGLFAVAAVLSAAGPAHAMGYDSLACPELAERRIAYFTENGFCAPGVAEGTKDAMGKPCRAPAGPEGLPGADRTQVEMIVKVEARKNCPVQ